jgi:hypothetical protein
MTGYRISIPYERAMTEALKPQNIVGMNFMDGKAATYDMNPLTGYVEGLKFDTMPVGIPVGGPYEHKYRELVNQNVRREYLGVAIDFFVPPISDFFLTLGAGILDVLTLGFCGFSEKYDKKRDTILGKITEQVKYKHVTTEKDIPVLGVPSKQMPGGPGGDGGGTQPFPSPPGGSPLSGFIKKYTNALSPAYV